MRGQSLKYADSHRLQASILLQEIREQQDPSKFGYLIQGLFTHTLMRLGGSILEVEAQGHPDITCHLFGFKWRLEVSVISIPYTIDPDDLTAIRPTVETDRGFLALLDYALPMRWLFMPYGNISRLGGRRIFPAELKARADDNLSMQITEAFFMLIIDNRERLLNLDFGLLRGWALTGQGI
jgi:hypothetical protein